jgi:hypothetical protein
MNRWLTILMAPFLVFMGMVALWGAISLLFISAGIIAHVLRHFSGWIVEALPRMVVTICSDPWKIAALPMAVGVVIIVGFWAWEDFQRHSRPQVMRGRELGSSRAHKRVRQTHGRSQPQTQRGGKTPWTRSSPPRR